MENVKKHTTCRLCGGGLAEVMNFGLMPLANALASTKKEAVESERFEQALMFCEKCLLGQLSVVVNPEVLYKGYVYQSSVSSVFRDHCADLARAAIDRMLPRGGVFVDIAGNDGAMAGEVLKVRPDARAFVVDTAQNDIEEGWKKIKSFWNTETSHAFLSEHGPADVITAQNVVGHVDEIVPFFQAVRSALVPGGSFIVEVPSFKKLIEDGAFDTIYHEHVSYWTVSAMSRLAALSGFSVLGVYHMPVHCGTLRFQLVADETSSYSSGAKERESEAFFFGSDALSEFAEQSVSHIEMLNDLFFDADGRVIGITASAKSNVILNMMNMTVSPKYLVDDAPLKHWKFAPGIGVEIRPFTRENVKDARCAVILSRNLSAPLVEKLNGLGFRGITIGV